MWLCFSLFSAFLHSVHLVLDQTVTLSIPSSLEAEVDEPSIAAISMEQHRETFCCRAISTVHRGHLRTLSWATSGIFVDLRMICYEGGGYLLVVIVARVSFFLAYDYSQWRLDSNRLVRARYVPYISRCRPTLMHTGIFLPPIARTDLSLSTDKGYCFVALG